MHSTHIESECAMDEPGNWIGRCDGRYACVRGVIALKRRVERVVPSPEGKLPLFAPSAGGATNSNKLFVDAHESAF